MPKPVKFLIVLIIIAVAGAGFWKLTEKKPLSSGTTNYVQGAGNKKVTLIEYGDFECPVCSRYYSIIKQVKDKYQDDITVQFKHLPLNTLHPNAQAAHRAAEAAGRQGKFWEMHDKLYENQTTWSDAYGIKIAQATAIFEGYAKELGLDLTKYKSEVNSAVVNDAITADTESFEKYDTDMATPTFILNDKVVRAEEIQGDFNKFVEIIDKEIAAKNPATTETTTPESTPTPTPEPQTNSGQ